MPHTTGKRKKVAVIGAGLGGISAAISLAQEGYVVEVYERNEKIGGKLNVLSSQGYSFDLGPSILTLPHFFERLFARSGKKMSDYFSIRPLRPHWRNFFEDGTVINLFPERELMAQEAEKLGESPEKVEKFLEYSGRFYDLVNRGYFEEGLDTLREVISFYGPLDSLKFDFLRSMHAGVARHITHPHLRDVFDFFIKYVGSSALDAPAFMNCLNTIQFRYDLWYVDGGMYTIARGFQRLMEELGIRVFLDSEVAEIKTDGGRVTQLVLANRSTVEADIVVSNMEVIPAYRELLREDEKFLGTLEKFEPSCSGIVLDLGLDIQYPQLAHHNFFFAGNQRDHFNAVYREKTLPHDPTIYLVAASKTDPTVAPPGCDCLKILPHIPHIVPERPVTPEQYLALKETIVDKLERMGLTDLRKHIVFEHFWTPLDIEKRYRSNRGSIYGVVSDRRKNLAFKAPKQSTRYENLFFVGGSVNPGGGMPMVILCGQNVAKRVVKWDKG